MDTGSIILQAMVGSHIDDIIERAAAWKAKQNSKNRKERKKSIEGLRGAMDRLLSGDYGQVPALRDDPRQIRANLESSLSGGKKKATGTLARQIAERGQHFARRK